MLLLRSRDPKKVEDNVTSQAASVLVRDSDDEGDMRYAATDGHQQHRGENALGQYNFRVTVDCEQRIYGYCDEECDEPIFDMGTTIVTFAGAHLRMSNVSADDRWLEDEELWVGGKHVVRKAGEKVPEMLGKSLR